MPHISSNELDSRTKMQIIDAFDWVLGKMDKNEVSIFLSSIVTDTERVMIAKRLATAMMLKEGIDYQSISRALNVTKETVERIDLATMKRPKGFDLAFKKIAEDKVLRELKKALIGLASYAISAAGGRVKF